MERLGGLVEVAELSARLVVDQLASFMANMAAADAAVKRAQDDAEALQRTLRSVGISTGQTTSTVAALDAMERSISPVTRAAMAADAAMADMKINAVQVTETVAGAAAMQSSIEAVGEEADTTKRKIAEMSLMGHLLGREGGGGGIYVPFIGRGFRGGRAFGGMAAFGSLLGLAGFGAERALTSTLGIAGSLGGGLLGGGLLAGGALTTAAVGIGTDAAGIGQAARDTRSVSTALGQLNTAIQQYGRNSTQAYTAQVHLNTALASFSPIARNAVFAAAQTSQGFRTMFDNATGAAEKTGAIIINQAMMVGEKFLPTIGKFAAQNTAIIQRQLQPFFAWLQNPSRTGGLGVFTDLERIFQRNLPNSIAALTQGFQFFIRTMDVAAQHSGGLVQRLADFFTKMNQPGNFSRWAGDVNKLIGLFTTWMGLFGSIIRLTIDLARPMVGLGKALAEGLTGIINQVRTWINLTGTQHVLHNLFQAHTDQLKALFGVVQAALPGIEAITSAFLQLETAITRLTIGPLKVLADVIGFVFSNRIIDKILGWVAALYLANRAISAVVAGLKALVALDIVQWITGLITSFRALFVAETALQGAAFTQAEWAGLASGAEGAAVGMAGLATAEDAAAASAVGLSSALLGILGPLALVAGAYALLAKFGGNVLGTASDIPAPERNRLPGHGYGAVIIQGSDGRYYIQQSGGRPGSLRMVPYTGPLPGGGHATAGRATSTPGVDSGEAAVHAGQGAQVPPPAILAGTLSRAQQTQFDKLQTVYNLAKTQTQRTAAGAALLQFWQQVYAQISAVPAYGAAQEATKAAALQMASAEIASYRPADYTPGPSTRPRTGRGTFDPLTVAQHQAISQAQQALAQAQAATTATPSADNIAAQVTAALALQRVYQQTLTAVKAEHETGRARVRQLSEEATLARDIASTHREILRLQKEEVRSTIITNLFQGPYLSSQNAQTAFSFGYQPTGVDLMRDIRSQIQQSRRFINDLRTLRRHGASAALLESLRQEGQSMDPRTLEEIHQVASFNRAQLRQYEQYFGARQRQQRVEQMTVTANTVNVNGRVNLTHPDAHAAHSAAAHPRGRGSAVTQVIHTTISGPGAISAADQRAAARKHKFIATRRNY